MVVKTIVVRNLAARAYVGSNPTLPTKNTRKLVFYFYLIIRTKVLKRSEVRTFLQTKKKEIVD